MHGLRVSLLIAASVALTAAAAGLLLATRPRTTPAGQVAPNDLDVGAGGTDAVEDGEQDVEVVHEPVPARDPGMSRSFISLIEHGTHGVDVVRLLRLATAFGMSLAQLIGFTDTGCSAPLGCRQGDQSGGVARICPASMRQEAADVPRRQ